MTELYTNDPSTTLNGSMGTGDTSLTVVSSTGFPSGGNFRIRIDNELMLVTAVSGTTWTITRALESTTAATHSSGTTVNHLLTAGALDAIRTDISQSGAYASLPSTGQKAGNLYLPSDSLLVNRHSGSAWETFGPVTKFTDPNLQTWAWVNQGGATVDTTKGGIYLNAAKQSSSDNHRIYKKSTPATPYTAYFGFIPNIVSKNFQKAGVVWRNSSSGKLLTFYVQYVSGSYLLEYDSWTTSTTGGSGAGIRSDNFLPWGPMLWLALRDDGTTRYLYYSTNGTFYNLFYSEARTTFMTPDELGIDCEDSTNTYDAGMWLLSYKEV